MMSSCYRNHCMAVAVLATVLSTAALADQSGNAALTASSYLNLDSGAISNAGGDVFWNGTALAAQGQAGLYNLGPQYGLWDGPPFLGGAFICHRKRPSSTAKTDDATVRSSGRVGRHGRTYPPW